MTPLQQLLLLTCRHLYCCAILFLLLSFSGSYAWLSSSQSCPAKTTTVLKMSSSSNIINYDKCVNKDSVLPNLPLPKPILSTTPGTWAYDTMSRRVDSDILQRTYDDNKDLWESDKDKYKVVLEKFNQLRKDLQCNNKLQYLKDDGGTDIDEWNTILKPYIDNDDDWLSAPWLVTEFYVYRRLISAIGYFDKDSPCYQYDPFYKQKLAGLETSVVSAEVMLEKLNNLPDGTNVQTGIELSSAFALWGNKMDLSLWPADASNSDKDIFTDILNSAHENLLHDDSNTLGKHCSTLKDNGGGNVDIIIDNAGFELVTDLALGQYLIDSGIAKTVTYQLKLHPTFVSDALEKDLLETIEYYSQTDKIKYPNVQKSGDKWLSYIKEGKWICKEDRFWVQPLPMWDMYDDVTTDLHDRCNLVFVKGDANYRRLLGDRLWDYTSSFEDVVGHYFPCPICALRTLKAELGCGMDKDQVDRAMSMDDSWLVNGRFGVVQFSNGRKR